jgi:hypothetical protein
MLGKEETTTQNAVLRGMRSGEQKTISLAGIGRMLKQEQRA